MAPSVGSPEVESRHCRQVALAGLRSNVVQAVGSKLAKEGLHLASPAIWSLVHAPGPNGRGGVQVESHGATWGPHDAASVDASVDAGPASSPHDAVLAKRHARATPPTRTSCQLRMRVQ